MTVDRAPQFLIIIDAYRHQHVQTYQLLSITISARLFAHCACSDHLFRLRLRGQAIDGS
ncbi:MAG: hypothetical protein U0670_13680 [Anaerolineae bacterium]